MANRSDDFNRANGMLGGSSPSDGGSVWSGGAVMGIDSNQAKPGTTSLDVCSLDCGSADHEATVTIAAGAGGNHLVGVRVVDLNDYVLGYFAGGQVRLYEMAAGSSSQFGTTGSAVLNVGDVLAVSAVGTTILASVNGVPMATGLSSLNAAATAGGLGSYADTTPRYDDFAITDLGGSPPPPPAAAYSNLLLLGVG